MIDFIEFIENMDSIYVQVLGNKFTWFNLNGSAMRRIYRFLLTNGLIDKWKIGGQMVGRRDFSYYCPIRIKGDEVSWGSEPFKYFNCWAHHSKFLSFIEKK